MGTSTGSLLIPHLSIGEIDKIRDAYTTITPQDIFSNNPFVLKIKDNREYVTINHIGVLWQLIKGKRTIGESHSLRKKIVEYFTLEDYHRIRETKKDVVVTVSNLSKNTVEYKSVRDCSYEDFCDWMWISCNYVPFMSIVSKDGCEYADGGLGSVVSIEEAIKRGATEVDAIILGVEKKHYTKPRGKNPFSLMIDIFSFLANRIEYYNVRTAELAATNKNVKINLYYTPTKLTDNPLLFHRKRMLLWWQRGIKYAEHEIKCRQEDITFGS